MKKLVGYQKGVNLGGWLSQGSKEKSHLDSFITELDIKRIKEMGCDHLRLPVDYENIEDEQGNFKESGFQYIENCILWCKKYNLNVILDLHKTPGYVFDDLENSKGFFDNEALKDRFIRIWDELSSKFAKYTDMVMFEMLNEVTDYSYIDAWNALAEKCMHTIRKNAPTVKILYGGVGYSAVNAVKYLNPPMDENIVYNIHCYEPLIFTHQGAYWVDKMPQDFRIDYPFQANEYEEISKKVPAATMGALKEGLDVFNLMGVELFKMLFKEPVAYVEKYNVSLYCGEYGVIDLADPKASLRWLKDIHDAFEYYGIGRAIWSYKEMDFGIIGKHYAPIYEELVKNL